MSSITVGVEMNGSDDKQLDPVTPGEMLLEEFMEPLGLTKYRLAKAIHVPQTRIGEIIAGKRRITADTDLRLCRYFGLSEGYWQRLQVLYDTRIARRKLERELATIEPHPDSEVEEGVLASANELPEYDEPDASEPDADELPSDNPLAQAPEIPAEDVGRPMGAEREREFVASQSTRFPESVTIDAYTITFTHTSAVGVPVGGTSPIPLVDSARALIPQYVASDGGGRIDWTELFEKPGTEVHTS